MIKHATDKIRGLQQRTIRQEMSKIQDICAQNFGPVETFGIIAPYHDSMCLAMLLIASNISAEGRE